MLRQLEEFAELLALDLITTDEMDSVIEGYLEFSSVRESRVRRSTVFGQFDFGSVSDAQARRLFRFGKEDIQKLHRLLEIPAIVSVPGKFQMPGLTALCILLRRLSYPNRLKDLEEMFGLSSQALSFAFNYMVELIATNKGPLLDKFSNLPWLTHEKLEYYAGAVYERGAALRNCWGFIDGTARRVCRPSEDQKNYFSGHKRYHCLKYQSILTPDGVIVNLQGPYMGKRHDSGVLAECKVDIQLRTLCVTPNKRYMLYGDPGYATSDVLIAPYPAAYQEVHANFNKSMSRVRQSVEWGFGKIVNLFAFVDFHKNQKILLQDVGSMYRVATILTNCHTCLYGSLVSDYFDTEPPTLEQYLNT